LQYTYLYISIKDVSKLQKKPSALKREHPALQNMKYLIFVDHFCPPGSGSGFRIRIQIPIHWPDWIRIRNTSFCSVVDLDPELFLARSNPV
jgi:hypothetical protein